MGWGEEIRLEFSFQYMTSAFPIGLFCYYSPPSQKEIVALAIVVLLCADETMVISER